MKNRHALALASMFVFAAGCTAPHVASTCAPAPTAAHVTPRDAIDAFVEKEMAKQRVPGVAIAVIERGQAPKLRGYGLANVEHGIAVTPETIFQSGSMGKQFTSTLVMLLVEDGKLRLDDAMATYFPEAPPEMRAITVRHLLTHTSGIPDYETDSFDYHREYKEEDLLRLAFSQKLEFPPGSRWSYSNTGYVLLGFLVNRVTKSFYGDLLQSRVFRPTGMKTARMISESDIVPHRAAGYELDHDKLKNQDWVSPLLNTTADGSLYFSITDLVAWDRALRDGAILKPESWKDVYTPAKLTSGKTFPYGFGWVLKPINGHSVHRHGGAWQGFKTDILRYPDDGLTVIALCNLADASPDSFTDGIVRVVAPALAKAKPVPILDTDPAMTKRALRLLREAASGTLSRDELAHLRAGQFDSLVPTIKKTLAPLGEPTSLVLFEREELGDDRVLTYRATYGQKTTFEVILKISPDDKLALFLVVPLEPD